VDWFDELDWESIAQPQEQRSIKKFFQAVYENDTSAYTRKKAIEWFSELALGDVLRLTAAKEFLLDITEDESFIRIAKIKYLFLLFGDDDEVWQELTEAANSSDAEVSSEAYYRQGLIHLLYRTGQATETVFCEELQQATTLFHQAVAEVGKDDRIDARFFGIVTQYLVELLAGQKAVYAATMRQLDEVLWQRKLWSRRPVTELFEWHIYRALSNMQAIAEHTNTESSWVNFSKEFSRLSKHFNDMVAATAVSRQLQQSYQQFTNGVGARIINQYYTKNLFACEDRLNTIIADEDSSSELYGFLLSVRNTIQAQQQKKNTEPNFLHLASVLRYYPHIPAEKVREDFQRLIAEGKPETEVIVELIFTYSDEKPAGSSDFVTGYDVGDEVFNNLIKELKAALPKNYPQRKWAMISDVLSDIIRYAYQTALLPKEFFPHLHTEKPTHEAIFHRDFFRGLSSGPRATYYNYETPDRIGGGRIDITYQRDGLVYPIEVKRKKSKVTWAIVSKNYLAQAQSYTVVHEQVGFLVVFDLKSEAVRRDFRNYFRVLHRPSPGSIEEVYKDYVVCVIIPASNASPSASTTY
jgi:hypothetical protein